MFTGIIETTVELIAADLGTGQLRVSAPAQWESPTLGQSIALDGCCLTIVEATPTTWAFAISQETISKTTLEYKKPGSQLNVERGMKLGDRLDGHMVTGHIDDRTQIRSIVSDPSKGTITVAVELRPQYRSHVVSKGSVALDGISLTVNDIDADHFTVTLIPHTRQVTTWKTLVENQWVNVEFDILGKYVARAWSHFENQTPTNVTNSTGDRKRDPIKE